MSEELAEGLQEAMLERLRDKQPPVRVQAIAALSRLADPGQVMTQTGWPNLCVFAWCLLTWLHPLLKDACAGHCCQAA